MTYDFSGYATKHNILCSDGRTIKPEAFKDCDGMTVPLVWRHMHDSTENVLGHAELENRSDGVYAYCSFNKTPSAETARELVRHGDISALSIYANHLKQHGGDVVHGIIREVSLVLAGANPGATIDNVAFAHEDGSTTISEDEAYIAFVDDGILIMHEEDEGEDKAAKQSESDEDRTIGDVLDDMTDEQREVVSVLLEMAKNGELEDTSEEAAEETVEETPQAEEVKHADEEETDVDDIFDSLTQEQKKAVEAIKTAIIHGEESVPKDVQSIFNTLTEDQKNAVYVKLGELMEDNEDEMAHEDETIGDILSSLSKEQAAAVQKILNAIANESKVDEETTKIFDTLSDKQKDAVYAMVGLAMDSQTESESENQNEAKHSDFEGEEMPKYNIFESNDHEGVLSHEDLKAVFEDAPRFGSLRESVLSHGITDIEVLFPEAQAVNNVPATIQRRMEWVSVVLNGVHKTPFSRLKSTAVNLTEDQARAKGYIKGRKKIEEQIAALRRVTTPQTVYKLQKLDRDDILDITDFDVVAFMKQEMRMMLDEEIARAILVGDGRTAVDPEKIFEDHIRPVWSDDDVYTIHRVVPTADANDYEKIIDEVVRSRKGYRGSGNPIMFIGPDILTEMRLLKDQDGRYRYDSDQKLAEAMRVSRIEEVELFDDLTRSVQGKDRKLVSIILNLSDYTVGANKGGEVNMFDDFDLDYNKMEYLIETRISGALTQPKSAIAIEIQMTDDSPAQTAYELVTDPDVKDIADYYEQDEYGRYLKTNDVAIVSGKRYFTLA